VCFGLKAQAVEDESACPVKVEHVLGRAGLAVAVSSLTMDVKQRDIPRSYNQEKNFLQSCAGLAITRDAGSSFSLNFICVKSQDIVNCFERSVYFVEVSGHREPCQAVLE
jgi:hypothetical protein